MCTGAAALVQEESARAGDEADSKAPRLQLSLADFELLRRIGDGSYSHVVLARHRATGQQYALKVIDKQYILRHQVVDYIRQERQILDALHHPGVAAIHFTFQDAYSLYLGLEYCPNGELYDQIRLKGRLPETTAAHYAAEVVQLLGHLRERGVVHRDLKPENLLLDADGHLKLIDFGSAKQLGGAAKSDAGAAAAGNAGDGAGAAAGAGNSSDPHEVAAQAEAAQDGSDGEAEGGGDGKARGGLRGSRRAVSLVGTADYVSPEVLNNQPVTCAADLWALGCVLYQMLTGRPPFKSPSEYLTFQKIVEAEYELPKTLSPEATDLLTRLLRVEPTERIGAADLAELRAHPFFGAIDWPTLRTAPAPDFIPDMEPALSTGSSFDWELQSLASALPPATADDHLQLE